MQKIDNNSEIMVVGFRDDTPLFLSQNYYKKINRYKKYKNKYIVFCFYCKSSYGNSQNALIISNGKIIDLFGESFSKRESVLNIFNKKIVMLFYFDICSHKTNNYKNIFDVIIGFDDDKLEESKFLEKKYNNKIIIFGKNGDVKTEKYKKIIKTYKNICKLNIQIFDKLIE